MKQKNKFVDERVIAESNKIYKICYYIICIAFFVDIVIKFNLWGFSESSLSFMIYLGLESIFLVAIFLFSTFLLAKKGITVFATDLNNGSFPKRRYMIVSAIGGIVVSVGLWTIRFATGSWEYGLLNAILFCGCIYIITFLIAFIFFFAILYCL